MRRTAAETRALILDAGVEMLFDRGVTAGVHNVRLRDVLEEVGLTTGAAYRIWENQDEFHRDLAVAATAERNAQPLPSSVIDAARTVLRRGGTVEDMVRACTDAQMGDLIATVDGGDPSTGPPPAARRFVSALALRAASMDDVELAAASRERHERSIRSFSELYSGLLRAYRMRIAPPFTLAHFAAALASLTEGFALQLIADQRHETIELPIDDTEGTRTWTLYGACVGMIVDRMVEPDPDAAPAPGDVGGK